jgi:hypothetical protein
VRNTDPSQIDLAQPAGWRPPQSLIHSLAELLVSISERRERAAPRPAEPAAGKGARQ